MVSYFYHPEYSGSSVQAFNLSRRLTARGLRPRVVSARLSRAPAQDLHDGVAVTRLPVIRAGHGALLSFWLSLAWHLFRERRHFDVVHAHGTVWHQIVGVLGRALGKKTILKIAMWRSDLAFETQGRLSGAVNRWLVERFDCYIATTPEIAEEIASSGLDHRRTRQIPNGVDTLLFHPLADAGRDELRRELHLPPGPLVAFVGILNARKKVDALLRIWQRVVQRGGAGHLLVIGPAPDENGDYVQGLRTFVERQGLGARVSFLGRRSDVASCLQASDAFVFPSSQEGMPNAVLEAMAAGLPCVVSRGSGIDRVIDDGVNGFLRDADDEEAFAVALTDLLREPGRRARMGALARQAIVEGYSLEAVADRYVSLYRELVAAR